MLLVAPVRERRSGAPVERRDAQLQGLDKLKAIRSERAGDHARRLLGPRADGRRRPPRPLLQAAEAFEAQTGCPVIINTSFNVRGEPIVCTPEDAYRCFMATNMDVLVLERFRLAQRRAAERHGARDRRVPGPVPTGLT